MILQERSGPRSFSDLGTAVGGGGGGGSGGGGGGGLNPVSTWFP